MPGCLIRFLLFVIRAQPEESREPFKALLAEIGSPESSGLAAAVEASLSSSSGHLSSKDSHMSRYVLLFDKREPYRPPFAGFFVFLFVLFFFFLWRWNVLEK